MASTNDERSAYEFQSEISNTRRSEKDIPNFGPETLKIRVGEDDSCTQTFLLHKDIANKFSDFFAAASRNGWKEAVANELNLPDDDPELFRIFEAFAYSGCVYSQRVDDEYTDEDGDICDYEYSRLFEAWVLGDKLQASAFKDLIVDALIEKVRNENQSPVTGFVTIYEQSVSASPMKELLLDMAAWAWSLKSFAIAAKEGHGSAFFADLATKQAILLRQGKSAEAPYLEGSTCKYHEHGEDKPCYKTMFK